MSVKEAIQAKVAQVYKDASPNVYKGNADGGTIQAHGWWYKPFNRTPIFLGASLAEALEMLEDVATTEID